MTEPLRIIHCFRSPVGGIFRHVRDLAFEHSKAGHKVGILCDSSTGGEHEDRLFAEIMPYLALGVTRLPIRRSISLSDLGAMRSSYKLIKSLQPDVLHGHGAKGGVIARGVGSALRVNRYCVARFYTAHGGSLHFSRSSLRGKMVFALERLQQRVSDGIVFICKFEEESYFEKVGKPIAAHRMIYSGILEKDFRPIPVRENAVDVMYVGMLRDLKGGDVFIKAVAKAERILGRPVSAAMIGDGPDQEKYRAMISEKGLSKRIRMHPAMPIAEALSQSALLAVPSRAEALPYIVLEALGAERALIATRVGGVPEILGADNPAVVPPNDADALADMIARALTEPDWKANAMPPVAETKARFSAPVMAANLLDFYRETLQRI